MIKRFRIETPEQLRTIAQFCLWGETACHNFATVWNATRNQRGVTAWDNDFSICLDFSCLESCKAYIDKNDEHIAEIKYNDFLAFTREQLRMIDERRGTE